jgi:hypothetical protein
MIRMARVPFGGITLLICLSGAAAAQEKRAPVTTPQVYVITTPTPSPPPTTPTPAPRKTRKKEQKVSEPKLPQEGLLASSGGSSTSTDVFGDIALKEGEGPPISGSVSRMSTNQWQVKVFNNSKDLVSGSFAVFQFDRLGNRIKQDRFTVTLRPGESMERRIPGTASSVNSRLSVTGWKATKVKEAAPTPASEDTNPPQP